MIVAKWGVHSFRADANKVAEEIKSIGEEVKPDQIVQYAKDNPESEVYKCFTWNNDIAAEKWRLHEARMIVRNLIITVVKEDVEMPKVRMFLRTDTTGGYKETVRIYKNENEIAKMLLIAKKELFAFKEKYKILSNREELKSIFSAIEEIE